MKTVLLIFATLITLNASFAGTNADPEEIRDVTFYSCGSTDAGNNDDLEKFVMSAELEDGIRVLTSSETGDEFAICKNIEKGIKCKLGLFRSFTLHYSKLRYRTDLETGSRYYSIKSTDHTYQCDQY
jgi:hypothetical protein